MRPVSVLEKFSEYCNPRKNITILRHKFFTYRQHEEQNFHDFVTDLKKLSSECQFETLHESLIKDMIVCVTNDDSLRERLLRESELTLSKAISAVHATEETHKYACKILKSNETMDLHKISKHSKSRSRTSAQTTEKIKKCKFCENSHHRCKCPVYGKVCHNFNRKNHFKKCCPRNSKTLRKIEQIKTESPSGDEYEFFLDTMKIFKIILKIWITFLKSKLNPPIRILLYLLMVLEYPIIYQCSV